jgi:hypothetical protein
MRHLMVGKRRKPTRGRRREKSIQSCVVLLSCLSFDPKLVLSMTALWALYLIFGNGWIDSGQRFHSLGDCNSSAAFIASRGLAYATICRRVVPTASR